MSHPDDAADLDDDDRHNTDAWDAARDQAVHDREDTRMASTTEVARERTTGAPLYDVARALGFPALADDPVRCGALGCGARPDGTCGRGEQCPVGV